MHQLRGALQRGGPRTWQASTHSPPASSRRSWRPISHALVSPGAWCGCTLRGHPPPRAGAPRIGARRGFSTKFVIDPKLYSKAGFEARTGKAFGPLSVYEDLTAASPPLGADGGAAGALLERNPHQLRTLEALDAIFRRSYGAAGNGDGAARGLYIHGPAGSGKSMCMDLFFYCCEEEARAAASVGTAVPRSKREHFHEFMYRVHRGLHRLQKEAGPSEATADERSHGFSNSSESVRPSRSAGGRNGVVENRIVKRIKQSQTKKSTFDNLKMIAQETRRDGADILCFDEFAITAIQDCVVLSPLFIGLFEEGVVVVITSNRHPDDLYEGGLNREQHLPRFLETLYKNMDTWQMHTKDYRLAAFEQEFKLDNGNNADESSAHVRGDADHAQVRPRQRHRIFFGRDDSDSAAATAFLQKQGVVFTSDLGAEALMTEVEVGYGRKLMVEAAVSVAGGSDGWDPRRVARFSIDDLIRKPLSADDYNAICRQFHTILVDGLWVLQVEDHNEAKRMTNFLDTAYENHVLLLLTGMEETRPEAVFAELNMMEDPVQEELAAECHPSKDAEMQVQESATMSEHGASIKGRNVEGVRKEDAVRRLEAMQSGVQSCLFYSADHKNWSVESKFVFRPDARAPRTSSLSGSWFSPAPAAESLSGKIQTCESVGAGETDTFTDDSAEQETVKGVMVAAVASLNETSFAAKRAISRLNEMQTRKYMMAHNQVHSLGHCLTGML